MGAEGNPQEAIVLLEQFAVRRRVEFLNEPGRTLNVGEEERDCAVGRLPRDSSIKQKPYCPLLIWHRPSIDHGPFRGEPYVSIKMGDLAAAV